MSLRSAILDAGIRVISPSRWLRDRLAALEVKSSWVDPNEIDQKLPWRELRLLGRQFKPYLPYRRDNPFPDLGPIVDEEDSYSLSEQVDIRDIYGVCASKSHIVPLARLSQTWTVDDILAKRDLRKLSPGGGER
jgi:hypothetical protein